jgi:hypothetical protein|tara:strand:+ start:438 stop:554 length:117 start_codon:yes stop_codon:yes gene_type:complete
MLGRLADLILNLVALGIALYFGMILVFWGTVLIINLIY